jgi:hypothetical protein
MFDANVKSTQYRNWMGIVFDVLPICIETTFSQSHPIYVKYFWYYHWFIDTMSTKSLTNKQQVPSRSRPGEKCLIYPPDLKPKKIVQSDQPRLLFVQLQFSECRARIHENVSNLANQLRLDCLVWINLSKPKFGETCQKGIM